MKEGPAIVDFVCLHKSRSWSRSRSRSNTTTNTTHNTQHTNNGPSKPTNCTLSQGMIDPEFILCLDSLISNRSVQGMIVNHSCPSWKQRLKLLSNSLLWQGRPALLYLTLLLMNFFAWVLHMLMFLFFVILPASAGILEKNNFIDPTGCCNCASQEGRNKIPIQGEFATECEFSTKFIGGRHSPTKFINRCQQGGTNARGCW